MIGASFEPVKGKVAFRAIVYHLGSIGAVVAVAAIGLIALGWSPPGGGSPRSEPAGIFFRLRVALSYRGESVPFDIVVGCNVRQISYKDNSRTEEVGLVPAVFGKRMPDGRGLVVRPPAACRGETTQNGQAPADLLPVVIVYDDADTLGFGTAYLSEDAYENPLSVLRFGGASIETASRADFEAFRREQPNLVSRSTFHTPKGPAALKERDLPASKVPFGNFCHGYARFRLVGEQQVAASDLWPSSRPRFWLPTRDQDSDAINGVSYARPMRTDVGEETHPRWALMAGLNPDSADFGMLTRRGGGRLLSQGRIFPPSYFPDISSWVRLLWPKDPEDVAMTILQGGPHVGASIDFRDGATRGFAYCHPHPLFYSRDATGKQVFGPVFRIRPAMNLVDGEPVEQVPPTSRGYFGAGPRLIVERDEYIFQIFTIGLQSTRGDV